MATKEYNSYADERDPERLQQISGQALKDVEWLVQKVIMHHISQCPVWINYAILHALYVMISLFHSTCRADETVLKQPQQ